MSTPRLEEQGIMKLNLQMFAEGEEAASESVDTVEESVDNNDTPVEDVFGEDGTEEPEVPAEFDFSPFLEKINDGRIKYNKEPVTIESLDELINGYQKGLNYDKVSETKTTLEQELDQARNNPHLALLNTMAEKYGFSNIDEYEAAVKSAWEQEEIDKLVQQNIPEEYAKEMLDNKKFRQEFESKNKETQEKERIEKENQEFVETFPAWKDITPEQWKDINAIVDTGKDLTSAYAIYLAKNMDSLKVEAEQEAIKKLSSNADTSPGSVNEQSSTEQKSMSIEQVNSLLESMSSGDRNKWIDKNMDNLEKWGYFSKQ